MLESAFWRAIQESPEDDTPRLVYADWLEEQGSPAQAARAEFIRVQCELARDGADAGPEAATRRHELRDRETALWAKHGKAWCAALKPFSRKFSFARGFPDQVLVQGPTFLASAEAVLDAAPVFSIRLRNSKDAIAGLAECPHLERLISLSLYWNKIGQARARTLFASRHLTRISHLDLDDNNILRGGLAALLEADMPRLRSLNLRGNMLGEAGLVTLAGSPRLAPLRSLVYPQSEVTPAGAGALARSPLAANLTDLDLRLNPALGDEGAAALAHPSRLDNLTRLILAGCGISPAGAAALASSTTLGRLTTLNLSHCRELGDAGVRALTSSAHLGRLTHLSLSLCNLTSDALASLAEAPFLGGLRSLDLSSNDFRAGPGLTRLAESGRLGRLRTLDLNCPLRQDGVEALLASPEPAGLEELVLGMGVTLEDVTGLADSPALLNLHRLDLTHARIGDRGADRLAASRGLRHLRRLRFGGSSGSWRASGLSQAGVGVLLERFGEEVCEVI